MRPPESPVSPPHPAGGDWGVRVAEASPDGLWVLDAAGTTTWANARMAHLLGLSADELAGRSAYELLAPESHELVRAHLERMDRAHASYEDQECCLLRPDGSTAWARLRHAPLPDADGRVRSWLHRISDVADGERRLDQLERREQQFAEVQRLARIGSWEWDRATRRLTASEELYEFYGIEPGAMDNSFAGFLDLIHPEDREQAGSVIVDSWKQDGVFGFDFRLVNDAGELKWFRSRGRAWHDEDGRITRLVGTSQDITETKENQNALAFLGAMGRAANGAQSLQEALLSAGDLVRPHAQWPGVVVSVPRPDGHALAHLDLDWVDVDEATRAAAHELAERAARDQSIVCERAPDGVSFLVAGAAAPGGRLACVVVSRALTTLAPRPVDLEVFEQMISLLARVAEREWAAEDLAGARDDALAASRAKSDFLATMSHEIRTPLNGVIGLSELLGSTDLTPHQRRLSAGVDQAGRTLLALVNDILDLSKIEAGRLDLEELEFDPLTVVEQSVGLVAGRAAEKQLELVVSSGDALPTRLVGDPVRFGQVITNLAANAVKFTSAGEVVVRLETEPVPGASVVRVSVTDTGIGIEAGVAAGLFDAFTQADSSTTRRFGGTGLGLAISKRIVEAMGGGIGVQSEPGVGSTFWFTVTLAEPAAPAASPATAPEELVAGLRVLVVDDNETNRLIITEKLTGWRVAVSACASSYEALLKLDTASRRGAPYDVVLLDYMMPGADGEQLARIIRGEARHDGTRLVLLSSAMEPSGDFLTDAGIDVYLAKPVLPSRLLDTLVTLGGRVDPAEAVLAPPTPALGTPRGRILVVEDNPVNQMVAEGILQRSGFEVVIAENGAEAVARLSEEAGAPGGFDVVLMDCQMPVMDGYAATRAIRAAEPPGVRRPVVAMTAAVTGEERARCLAAGMDDFLSKPVDVAQLEATLARWLGAGRGAEPELSPTSEHEPVLDVDRLRELLRDGAADADLLGRLMGRFGERAVATCTALAAAVAAGDAAATRHGAHDLRGGAANLGLARLAALAEQIERGAVDGLLPPPGVLHRLEAEVEAATAALTAYAGAGALAP